LFCLGAGLLFYLTLLALVCLLVHWFWPHLAPVFLAGMGILLAIVCFILGVAEAFYPVLKKINLSLPTFPSVWRGRRIIQLSDVHLGNFYGPKFLKKQVTRVNRLQPDLIVITGDLFDGTADDLEAYLPVLQQFQAVAGVFFVLGNHDLYLGKDKIRDILSRAGIGLLDDEALIVDGLEIIGLSFNKKPIAAPVIRNLNSDDTGGRLLLRHVPVGLSWAEKNRIALQLSGHTHRGQMFPLALLTRIIFGRYHYGWHQKGGFNIYTSSGVGSWGPPVRLFNRSEIIVITVM